VYVLENPAGKFYIGHTNDLDRRIQQHNSPETVPSKFTQKNGPWTLVYSEPRPNRGQAMQREKFIKSRKSASWIRQHLLKL
jgi:predicted GIY-YIG superfamily endonuclease